MAFCFSLGVRAGGAAPADASEAALLRALRSLLATDAASAAEAGSWLRDAAAAAAAACPPATVAAAFARSFEACGAQSTFSAAALSLATQHLPAACAGLLAEAPGLWARCFTDNGPKAGDSLCVRWFGAFSPDGRHGPGAASLSRLLAARRDAVWHCCRWRPGVRPMAPAGAAARPEAWMGLDAPATIDALAAALGPALWRSDEISGPLRAGAVLALDRSFFVSELQALLGAGGAPAAALRAVLRDALAMEPPRPLCQRLMLDLSSEALLSLLPRLAPPADRILAAPMAHWHDTSDACLAAAAVRSAPGLALMLQERAAAGCAAAVTAMQALRDVAAAAESSEGEAALAAAVAAAAAQPPPRSAALHLLLRAFVLRWRLHQLPSTQLLASLAAAGLVSRREVSLDSFEVERQAAKRRRKEARRARRAGCAMEEEVELWRCSADGFATAWDARGLAGLVADTALAAWLAAVDAGRQ